MPLKTTINYSPNFNIKKRKKNSVRFLIFHYTGMRNEKDAINRLTNIQSEVSTHYFIKNDGKILLMVPDLYIAWHAGISQWKKFAYLNKKSIGIEIANPGHKNGYKNYSKKQINSLIILSSFLIKKYKINKNFVLGHSDIAPERKKDPGEKFPWQYLAKFGIGKWHSISNRFLKKKRMEKIERSEEKKFYNNLSKIGYSLKIPKKIKKDKFLKLLISAFQRRFRQELINGKIDKECFLISQNLAKKLN